MLASRLLRVLRATSNAPRLHAQLHLHAPLTGLFAVNKPTGVTSTTIVDHLQHVCQRNRDNSLVKRVLELDNSKRAKRGLVKIGHGGTLDPIARGIVGAYFLFRATGATDVVEALYSFGKMVTKGASRVWVRFSPSPSGV